MNLTNEHKMNAMGNVANEFIKELAPETLPEGLLMGETPGSNPVDGTTEDLGVVDPVPSDSGAGAGALTESLLTEEGGAISGGNC